MNRLKKHNIREIERLSQRGKTLSIVDLLYDNTLNVEMAAYLLYIVEHGASFLTAAGPGNAGKTTLMQCLLTYLPSNTRIVTISDAAMLSSPPVRNERTYYLVHEIGSGSWFGYLWGNDVGRFFSLIDKEHFLASCIHADTLDEIRTILLSDELNVAEEDFRKLDLILFMHLERSGFKYTRRIASIYEATGASVEHPSHKSIFLWDRETDTFHKQEDSILLKKLADKEGKSREQVNEQISEYEDFIERLMSEEIRDFRKVHEEILHRTKDEI